MPQSNHILVKVEFTYSGSKINCSFTFRYINYISKLSKTRKQHGATKRALTPFRHFEDFKRERERERMRERESV